MDEKLVSIYYSNKDIVMILLRFLWQRELHFSQSRLHLHLFDWHLVGIYIWPPVLPLSNQFQHSEGHHLLSEIFGSVRSQYILRDLNYIVL